MATVPGRRHANTTILQLAWQRYKKNLVKRPLATKVPITCCQAVQLSYVADPNRFQRPQAVTSACVASVSDVIAQKLVGDNYSFIRTLKMAVSFVQGQHQPSARG